MSNKSYLSVYARSFSWAGFFLPKETLKKCSELYDFCRVVDNIADDDEQIQNKEKKFVEFENDFNQKNFDDPIIKNMWDLIEEFNISLKIVQDLLSGIKSDIKKDDQVIQYIGDKVTKKEGDRRADIQLKKAEKNKKTGMVYVFELNKKYDIDFKNGYEKKEF